MSKMRTKLQWGLNENFKMSGRWWLPDNEAGHCVGTLHCSPSKITLTLIGSLDAPSLESLGIVQKDFDRLPVVHGITDHGKKVTLLNCVTTSRNHNFARTVRSSISPTLVLIGHHTKSLDELRVRSFEFGSKLLNAFVNNIGFDVQDNSQQRIDLTLHYVAPERRSIRVNAIRSYVDVDSSLNSGGTALGAWKLSAKNVVQFTPDEPQPLEWHIQVLWKLCHLITLLTDEQFLPAWITYVPEGEHVSGWLLYPRIRREIPTNLDRSLSLLLFFLAHLEPDVESVMEKWFGANQAFWDAVYLFIDARATRGHTIQARFLATTQAIEAFSRATTASQYMSVEEYETVRATLVQAIPGGVQDDHRQSLKKRIEFGYEHSFRKRIAGLLKSLSPEALECVCKSRGNFLAGVVDTRNYLVHHPDDLRAKALTGVELSWACERIVMLLRILLLRFIGLDEKLIVDRLKQHHRLMQYMWLYHEFPEHIEGPKESDREQEAGPEASEEAKAVGEGSTANQGDADKGTVH